MRLDKVEIVGFKSFCDKQELDFKGGVTGIVGPNGCGKSNISDAISWVLGEQSAKSLRGASMEDVIFAGSQSRQPVGMAEVNLKVSGLNGNSPDGNPDCVITRRLYRDGTSEYLMNGGVCRLRDIHELFMDTGLGSKAYSIIEQGKIGQILSSKPADRRALIEEAAGITRYRVRRRQTALKLEAAHQNLLRVNDIIHEVEKQLDSLKRQASKARRYRALREEMQGVERILFGLRYLALAESARGLDERLAAEGAREQAAAIALATEEARSEARRNELYQEEARLEEARKNLAETTLAVDRHHGRSGYCKEQAREAATRADQARQEAGELESRVAPLLDELGTRQGEEKSLREELAAAEEEARGAEAAVQACARRLAENEAALDAARDEQVTTMGRIAALQNARESASNAAERAGADLLKLASESQELERERGQLEEARHGALAREREAEARATALAGRRDGVLAETSQARERASSLGREADLLESERDGLAGRLSSLEEMVATHSAFDEGVRALLTGAAGVEVLGVVADCVETDSAHERAVEAFMGDRLQTLLTPDGATAAGCIRFLKDSGAGRATILPLAWSHTETAKAPLRELVGREPRAKGLVSDLYRVTGPHAEQIRASLPDGLVTESLDDALDVQSRHPGVPCVSLGGDTVRAGLVEGGRGVKGLLAPRREIREIGARLVQIGSHLSSARGQEAEEASRAEAMSAEARTLEESIHAAEKDLVAIRHDLAVAEEETGRILRKATVLETERSLAEQERSAAAVRLGEIDEALGVAEERRARGSERLSAAISAMGEARAASDTAQERSAEARSRLAALRERGVAAEAECRRLSEDHAELLGRIAAARARVDEMERRGSELTAEIDECERLLAEALNERERRTREAAALEDVVRDIRNELEARELAMKEGRRQRETLRQTLSELEVAQARTGSDLDHLARECQQAVGQTAAEAAAALAAEDQAREVAALEAELAEQRERLERMGPVNVLAVEQAQELDERERFLTAQRQDLLDSIAEMERAIKGIDRTSRERFQDAFQVINQHFGEVFKQLFGGGTAGLSLIDEEDILESGIDVMAQPPGKRLQNVMLLSGGEKALTAIALLFAIFQYKPSPFCILDEVDAPLDDANIGRFVRMLEGLKDQTQFVLITHSRRTMQIADQLYGVTMEEPGVSKLVSVRFT